MKLTLLVGLLLAFVGCSSASPPQEASAETDQALKKKQVSPPTFDPTSTLEIAPFQLTMADATAGASICYTLNGQTPTCSTSGSCSGKSIHYVKPLSIGATVTDPSTGRVTVEAIACHAGMTNSAVSAQVYQLQAAEPTFSPTSSLQYGPTAVTVSDSTPGVVLCVTEDGTVPTCTNGACSAGSQALSPGGSIEVGSGRTTLSAVGCEAGYLPSPAAATIYDVVVADPVLSPPSGTFTQPTAVTVTDATPGAVVCVTENGQIPTCNAGTCSPGSLVLSSGQSLLVIASGTQLLAVGCEAGLPPSNVVSAVYTINL